MDLSHFPPHVVAAFHKFAEAREKDAYEKGKQCGREEVLCGLKALSTFLPSNLSSSPIHPQTIAVSAPVSLSHPSAPPVDSTGQEGDEFDLDSLVRQLAGDDDPLTRQYVLSLAMVAVKEAFKEQGKDPTAVLAKLQEMADEGGVEAATGGDEEVWLAWTAQQTKTGKVKAVGTEEHQGRTLYGRQAESALRAQDNRGKRDDARGRRDDLVAKLDSGELFADDDWDDFGGHLEHLTGKELGELRWKIKTALQDRVNRGMVKAGRNKGERVQNLQTGVKNLIQHAIEQGELPDAGLDENRGKISHMISGLGGILPKDEEFKAHFGMHPDEAVRNGTLPKEAVKRSGRRFTDLAEAFHEDGHLYTPDADDGSRGDRDAAFAEAISGGATSAQHDHEADWQEIQSRQSTSERLKLARLKRRDPEEYERQKAELMGVPEEPQGERDFAAEDQAAIDAMPELPDDFEDPFADPTADQPAHEPEPSPEEVVQPDAEAGEQMADGKADEPPGVELARNDDTTGPSVVPPEAAQDFAENAARRLLGVWQELTSRGDHAAAGGVAAVLRDIGMEPLDREKHGLTPSDKPAWMMKITGGATKYYADDLTDEDKYHMVVGIPGRNRSGRHKIPDAPDAERYTMDLAGKMVSAHAKAVASGDGTTANALEVALDNMQAMERMDDGGWSVVLDDDRTVPVVADPEVAGGESQSEQPPVESTGPGEPESVEEPSEKAVADMTDEEKQAELERLMAEDPDAEFTFGRQKKGKKKRRPERDPELVDETPPAPAKPASQVPPADPVPARPEPVETAPAEDDDETDEQMMARIRRERGDIRTRRAALQGESRFAVPDEDDPKSQKQIERPSDRPMTEAEMERQARDRIDANLPQEGEEGPTAGDLQSIEGEADAAVSDASGEYRPDAPKVGVAGKTATEQAADEKAKRIKAMRANVEAGKGLRGEKIGKKDRATLATLADTDAEEELTAQKELKKAGRKRLADNVDAPFVNRLTTNKGGGRELAAKAAKVFKARGVVPAVPESVKKAFANAPDKDRLQAMWERHVRQLAEGGGDEGGDAGVRVPKAKPPKGSPAGKTPPATTGGGHKAALTADERKKAAAKVEAAAGRMGGDLSDKIDPFNERAKIGDERLSQVGDDLVNAVGSHQTDRTVGPSLADLYDVVGKRHNLTPDEFKGAVRKLHDQGRLKMSKDNGMVSEMRRPDLIPTVRGTHMGYAHLGDKERDNTFDKRNIKDQAADTPEGEGSQPKKTEAGSPPALSGD